MLRLGTSELEDAHSYPLGVSWPCKLELEALMELDLEEYVPSFELHSCRTCSKSLHPDETRGLARSQKKQLQSQGPTLSLLETHAHWYIRSKPECRFFAPQDKPPGCGC